MRRFMMRISYKTTVIVPILVGLFCLNAMSAGQGNGKMEAGYVFIDESGNESLNHETFNYYQGFALSLKDFSYLFDNGLQARANLQNISLNNRNLTAALSRPGLFSLSFNNSQYRRTYGSEGNNYTRRRTTGGQLRIEPHKNVAVFGGYSRVDRHGDEQFLIGPEREAVVNSVEYIQTELNFGSEYRSQHGFLKAEFRQYDLEDKVDGLSDRKANVFNLSLGSRLPKYDWVTALFGYNHRSDELAASNVELNTDQLWGATKIYLPDQIVLDYRILFARTEHTGNRVETDNWHNTVSIGKTWTGLAGLKVGYENRIVDDLTDRTVSDGFMIAGWYSYQKKLYARARVASRSKSVKSGVTLLGDEDFTRHLVSLKYVLPKHGTLAISWSGRVRENPDINSKSDYDMLSSQLNLNQGKYGRFTATYSYYLGKYENTSKVLSYEFSDHMVTGTYYPPSYHSFELSIGGSYYRSRRDNDLEKFDLAFGVSYSFNEDYGVEAKYRAYNFDDYLENGAYYTTNIVEVKIIRDIKL